MNGRKKVDKGRKHTSCCGMRRTPLKKQRATCRGMTLSCCGMKNFSQKPESDMLRHDQRTRKPPASNMLRHELSMPRHASGKLKKKINLMPRHATMLWHEGRIWVKNLKFFIFFFISPHFKKKTANSPTLSFLLPTTHNPPPFQNFKKNFTPIILHLGNNNF